MNLNSLKRGFTKTNPARGLRDLPGAQKRDRDSVETVGESSSGIPSGRMRVNGKYKSDDYSKVGSMMGVAAYIFAWICNGLIVFGWLLPSEVNALAIFCILAFALHGLAIFSDGFCVENTPWGRRSFRVFWVGIACAITFTMLGAMIAQLLGYAI